MGDKKRQGEALLLENNQRNLQNTVFHPAENDKNIFLEMYVHYWHIEGPFITKYTAKYFLYVFMVCLCILKEASLWIDSSIFNPISK